MLALYAALLLISAVAATWLLGLVTNERKRILADHDYRMAQLKYAEDENMHRRYLETAQADRTPTEAELSVRAAEVETRQAEARAREAEASAKEAETRAKELRRRY